MGERLTIGEVCTRCVTVAFRQTSISGAARLMREHHVGCLVVVDETEGQRLLAGVLTDRDIVTSVVAAELDAGALTVGEVMTPDPLSAREDDSLIDVMHAMRRKGVRRVPVVGGRGELLGLASLDDLLDVLSQELALLVGAVQRETERERQLRS